MFMWEKNVPPKRDPGFIKMRFLLGVSIYYSIEFFCKVRSHLTKALTLRGCFFPI